MNLTSRKRWNIKRIYGNTEKSHLQGLFNINFSKRNSFFFLTCSNSERRFLTDTVAGGVLGDALDGAALVDGEVLEAQHRRGDPPSGPGLLLLGGRPPRGGRRRGRGRRCRPRPRGPLRRRGVGRALGDVRPALALHVPLAVAPHQHRRRVAASLAHQQRRAALAKFVVARFQRDGRRICGRNTKQRGVQLFPAVHSADLIQLAMLGKGRGREEYPWLS